MVLLLCQLQNATKMNKISFTVAFIDGVMCRLCTSDVTANLIMLRIFFGTCRRFLTFLFVHFVFGQTRHSALRDNFPGVNACFTASLRAFFSCTNKYRKTFMDVLELGNIADCHVILCLCQMLVNSD